MPRSMLALVVCGLLFGCGGAPGDGESTQGNEAPYTQVEPREGASEHLLEQRGGRDHGGLQLRLS